MKKRGLLRIPRTLVRRKNAPKVIISEPINRQLKQYEEMILYQEAMIKSLYSECNEETKKKLLDMLSPMQRRNLKRKVKR